MPDHLESSLFSLIVPLFNEEENIPELMRRIPLALDTLGFTAWELILISDGSRDRTNEMISEIARKDPRVTAVLLSRNFGHQAAVSTGLTIARGSAIAIIDGDLQDPPEALRLLVQALRDGFDVAYGVREHRKENIFKRAAYFSFYRVLKRVAEIDIPLDTGDFCGMRRCVLDAMLQLPEKNRFLRGLRAWVGFQQVGVPYEREPRFAGRPKYTFIKLVRLAMDGLFAFSGLPVRVMQGLGFCVSLLSIFTAIGYLIWYFVNPAAFPRSFATLVISIWYLGGVQLFFMGMLGEYVVRTCEESRGRPVAVIAKTIRATDSNT